MAGSRLTDRRLAARRDLRSSSSSLGALERRALPDRRRLRRRRPHGLRRRARPRLAASRSTTGEYYTPPGYYFARRDRRLALQADAASGDPRPRRAGCSTSSSCSARCCSSRRSRASSGPAGGGSSSGRRRSSRFLPVVVETRRCSTRSRCRSSSRRSRSGSASGRSPTRATRGRSGSRSARRSSCARGRSATVAAVALALLAGRRWRALAIVLVLAALIPAPWYIHQRVKYGGQPAVHAAGAGPARASPVVVLLRPRDPDGDRRRSRTAPHHYTLCDPDDLRRDLGRLLRRLGLARGTPTAGRRRDEAERRRARRQPRAPVARSGSCRRCSRSSAGRSSRSVAARDRAGARRRAAAAARRSSATSTSRSSTGRPTATCSRRPTCSPTAAGWALGFGYALDRSAAALWPVTLVAARPLRSRRAAVPRLLTERGDSAVEHVLEEAVEPGPRLPAELGLDAASGRRRSPSGRTGRMNAGSTTTAGSPEPAKRADQRERVVAVELPRRARSRRARRRGRRAPRRAWSRPVPRT